MLGAGGRKGIGVDIIIGGISIRRHGHQFLRHQIRRSGASGMARDQDLVIHEIIIRLPKAHLIHINTQFRQKIGLGISKTREGAVHISTAVEVIKPFLTDGTTDHQNDHVFDLAVLDEFLGSQGTGHLRGCLGYMVHRLSVFHIIVASFDVGESQIQQRIQNILVFVGRAGKQDGDHGQAVMVLLRAFHHAGQVDGIQPLFPAGCPGGSIEAVAVAHQSLGLQSLHTERRHTTFHNCHPGRGQPVFDLRVHRERCRIDGIQGNIFHVGIACRNRIHQDIGFPYDCIRPEAEALRRFQINDDGIVRGSRITLIGKGNPQVQFPEIRLRRVRKLLRIGLIPAEAAARIIQGLQGRRTGRIIGIVDVDVHFQTGLAFGRLGFRGIFRYFLGIRGVIRGINAADHVITATYAPRSDVTAGVRIQGKHVEARICHTVI